MSADRSAHTWSRCANHRDGVRSRAGLRRTAGQRMVSSHHRWTAQRWRHAMTRLRGGQAVARALRAEGIDTVFGIVGTHNSLIFDGLTDLTDLRVVTPRHEGGAGFMAGGYARATGRPAAGMVVLGPGLTNLMTALGQSYLDSVPVLAVAGQNPLPTLDRRLEEFHELHGSLQIVGSVTASAARLTTPSDAPRLIREAVQLMRTGHPRPTFVE